MKKIVVLVVIAFLLMGACDALIAPQQPRENPNDPSTPVQNLTAWAVDSTTVHVEFGEPLNLNDGNSDVPTAFWIVVKEEYEPTDLSSLDGVVETIVGSYDWGQSVESEEWNPGSDPAMEIEFVLNFNPTGACWIAVFWTYDSEYESLDYVDIAGPITTQIDFSSPVSDHTLTVTGYQNYRVEFNDAETVQVPTGIWLTEEVSGGSETDIDFWYWDDGTSVWGVDPFFLYTHDMGSEPGDGIQVLSRLYWTFDSAPTSDRSVQTVFGPEEISFTTDPLVATIYPDFDGYYGDWSRYNNDNWLRILGSSSGSSYDMISYLTFDTSEFPDDTTYTIGSSMLNMGVRSSFNTFAAMDITIGLLNTSFDDATYDLYETYWGTTAYFSFSVDTYSPVSIFTSESSTTTTLIDEWYTNLNGYHGLKLWTSYDGSDTMEFYSMDDSAASDGEKPHLDIEYFPK